MFSLMENGTVITPAEVIENGGVLFRDGTIEDVGPVNELKARFFRKFGEGSGLRRIDAKGRVIMPGFINVHHHLYSTFSRGMSLSGEPAGNFVEILEKLWWKLDGRLKEEDIYHSALIPLLECIRNGVTTIVDHHESQGVQSGALDLLRRAVEKVGVRAALCIGTSDRYGRGEEGLKENERFLNDLKGNPSRLVAGMVGLHAPFTVNDETLAAAVALADRYGAGIHVHCAEDLADQKDSVGKYGIRVVERLLKFGAVNPKSLLVHCVHVDDHELKIIRDHGACVVHNPESNMNNAVGCADVLGMMKMGIRVGLGSDGMSSDMLAQMRCAYLLHRHQSKDPRVAFQEAPAMLLEHNAAIAAMVFGRHFGSLTQGAVADLIVLDYLPPTPLNRDNFLGHLLFGMVDAVVDTVVCDGRLLMIDKKLVGVDEESLYAEARKQAAAFWKRMMT